MSQLSESDDLERVPCLDDMCTGTLNARGVCNYCGKPGPVPKGHGSAPVEPTLAPVAAAEAPPPESEAPAYDPDERIPCRDDMCTGTLNEKGLCNYCGK